MHELSIAENIAEIVIATCKKAGADKVTRIELEIGRLSGIELDALQFALSFTLKNGLAEGAEVDYALIDGSGVCQDCSKASPMDDIFSVCSHCGSIRMDLIQGQELKIKKIEVIETNTKS
jgi:hydrogenase nickel incorporation protein HypA/HybF